MNTTTNTTALDTITAIATASDERETTTHTLAWRDADALPEEGGLYLVAFGSGVCKVGCSATNIHDRITSHIREVRRHTDTDVTGTWGCITDGAREGESAVLAALSDFDRASGEEWFQAAPEDILEATRGLTWEAEVYDKSPEAKQRRMRALSKAFGLDQDSQKREAVDTFAALQSEMLREMHDLTLEELHEILDGSETDYLTMSTALFVLMKKAHSKDDNTIESLAETTSELTETTSELRAKLVRLAKSKDRAAERINVNQHALDHIEDIIFDEDMTAEEKVNRISWVYGGRSQTT
jgi:hypothetical protein